MKWLEREVMYGARDSVSLSRSSVEQDWVGEEVIHNDASEPLACREDCAKEGQESRTGLDCLTAGEDEAVIDEIVEFLLT